MNKALIMSENCLYHRDRYQFADIEKELHQSKWLPRSHIHRLGMAVCCCRKGFVWDSTKDGDFGVLQNQSSKIIEAMDKDKDTGENLISPKLRIFLRNIIDTATVTDKSSCRFLEILYLALLWDYTFLTRNAVSNNEPYQSKLQKKNNTKQRLNPQQIQCIIRKKKNRMESYVVKLPMFPGNTSKMEVKLGFHLEKFAQRNKCFLQYERKMNDTSVQSSKEETFIRVWSSNPVAFKDTRAKLVQAATSVQQNVHLEKEHRKEMKAQRRLIYTAVDPEPLGADSYAKDTMSDDYDKKSWLKSTGRSRRGERKAQSSVLEGGHCLNCLTPFSSLKESTECKYHGGYIVLKDGADRWSCCDAEVEDSATTAEEHELSGCSTEVTHTWRVHKKANRKPDRGNRT